jgi:hypothetical protein
MAVFVNATNRNNPLRQRRYIFPHYKGTAGMPLTVDYIKGKRLRADGCVPSQITSGRALIQRSTSHPERSPIICARD